MAARDLPVFVVSHFHWDREWYRTMQGFRARLVDAVDQVLDLLAADPEACFVLDGQTIVLEDYLVVRPERRDELAGHVRTGRLAIGPWYVQPDSLLPSGESHVRNLLEGRRTAAAFGPVSTVAYVPDSFGHPAQFPQLFAGFGLRAFVHWRGNGAELDDLGPRWNWRGPDGTNLAVLHLTEGYFGASRPPDAPDEAATALAQLVQRQRRAGEEPVILMNGFDHTRPDPHIGALIGPLSAAVGAPVRRVTLDEAVVPATASADGWPEFAGELVGGRVANLLPGVWSTRLDLKRRNRTGEALLQDWAEPWAALGHVLGLADESASLREAWRKLLRNQAHDSICGCSIDAVHERMAARYDDAEGLADQTVQRVLERLAGRGPDREVPPIDELAVTVFNPSPHPVTGLVTVPLDAHPAFAVRVGQPDPHSLLLAGLGPLGFTVDGSPVRVVPSADPTRVRWLPDQAALDVEFVATDVPPLGCRSYRLQRSEPVDDELDDGREVMADDVAARVAEDGTLTVDMAGRSWSGLFGLEDIGDRGDSYDFDPVEAALTPSPRFVEVQRRRHASGIQALVVRRTIALPAALDESRRARSRLRVDVDIDIELTVAPGSPGVRARVRLVNRARDHRLRLRFPTGAASAEGCRAATTFDEARRFDDENTRVDDSAWVHPAPATFCHQGHVVVGGLTVVAPGLPEAELAPNGELLLTLVRSVGWLSRWELTTRPLPAGPTMAAPGAQGLAEHHADLWLLPEVSAARVRATVAGLRGVLAGPEPRLDADRSLLAVDDQQLVLSALKPAVDGNGIILRLLNPTDQPRIADVSTGFAVSAVESLRLDETPDDGVVTLDGRRCTLGVAAHALRTIRLLPG